MMLAERQRFANVCIEGFLFPVKFKIRVNKANFDLKVILQGKASGPLYVLPAKDRLLGRLCASHG